MSLQLQAQDIHFSQYYLTPILQNPALTGNFSDLYRISGIYRSQWYKVSNEPFRTVAIAYDQSIKPTKYEVDIYPHQENSFFGAGVQVFYDESGIGKLTNLTVVASGAYHHVMESGDRLSVGVQLGITQKKIDFSKSLVNNQYDYSSYSFNSGLATKENFGKNEFIHPDVNIGTAYLHNFANPRLKGYAGFAVQHLITPKETFLYTGTKQSLGMRYNVYLAADYVLSYKITLRPLFQFQTQSQGQDMNVGGLLGYKYQDAILYFGVQSRISIGNKYFDALMPSIGLKYKHVRVGLCYDVNFSGLKSTSKYQGGPELGFIYSKGQQKKLTIKRKLQCDVF